MPDPERPNFGGIGKQLRILHQLEIGEKHQLHLAALGALALHVLKGLVVVVELPGANTVLLAGVQHLHFAVLRVPLPHQRIQRAIEVRIPVERIGTCNQPRDFMIAEFYFRKGCGLRPAADCRKHSRKLRRELDSMIGFARMSSAPRVPIRLQLQLPLVDHVLELEFPFHFQRSIARDELHFLIVQRDRRGLRKREQQRDAVFIALRLLGK
jgi:hypothetical protein